MRDRTPLTERQQEVLDYVIAFRGQNGFSPTTREIAGRFGFRSQTAAMNHVRALKRKGYVTS